MTNRAIDLVTPKFLCSGSLVGLEKKMRDKIISSSKQLDFYFFQETKDGYIAWYRDELNFKFSEKLKPGEN